MLILTRKLGESLVINDNIIVTILSSQKNQVRIGVEAPIEITVHRDEIWNRISENRKEANKEGQADE